MLPYLIDDEQLKIAVEGSGCDGLPHNPIYAPIGAKGVDLGQRNLMPLLFLYMAMDRELALKHLGQAEAAVAEGLRHIAEQESRIKRLAGDGYDVAEAEDLLGIFLDAQRQHEAHRDWLKAELAEMGDARLPSARAG